MPSNQIEIQAFEAITALQGCASISAIDGILTKYIGNFGFEHYIISEMPPAGFKLEPHILMQNWPQSWYDHYLSQEHYDHDPIARHIETSIQPHRWRDIVETHRCTPRQRRVLLDATEIGMNDGFIIPLYGATHLLNCISFSGEYVDLPPRATDALYMVGMYAHESARSVVELNPQRQKKTLN